MKELIMKKEYIIGLLTGCLLTASALMFMGATDNDSQIGEGNGGAGSGSFVTDNCQVGCNASIFIP